MHLHCRGQTDCYHRSPSDFHTPNQGQNFISFQQIWLCHLKITIWTSQLDMCFNTFVCFKLNALLYWTGFVNFWGGEPGKSLSLKMLFSGQDVDRIERQHAPTVKLTLMAGSCSFNNIWLHTRKYKWWLEKTEDKGKAKCVICDKTFDISYTGRQHCPATLKQQIITLLWLSGKLAPSRGFPTPDSPPRWPLWHWLFAAVLPPRPWNKGLLPLLGGGCGILIWTLI